MNQFYADLFWGPGPDSQGTRRSAGGGWAGAGRAGLGLLAARGGAGSAQLSVAPPKTDTGLSWVAQYD
eukprot:COSAG02_NODE_88_length_38629_cov_457.967999_24_plen_68_part_00